MSDYSFRLDDPEIARYRAMAAQALAAEGEMWRQAGIGPGATVIDLGCGPGTFLPLLAERIAPGGTVIGLDQSEEALRRAAALVEHLHLRSVRLVQASADNTGLPAGQFDTVFMRNVLVHNGSRLPALLHHVGTLLASHGRLLAVEPDLSRLELPAEAPADRELEECWRKWSRSVGNDPAIGTRLADLLAVAGFGVDAVMTREDVLQVERSPAWTAVNTLVAAGFATADDADKWRADIERRIANTGPITARIPMHVAVARPPTCG